MNPTMIDTITRLFSDRKLSRRQSLAAGAGIAAGALATPALSAVAQDATPVAPDAEHGPEMLFVQSFQSGSIVPSNDVAGRYTITLDHGLGETIYFSDRPDRIVGSTPTAAFLDGLGFSDDNPPNAAILTHNQDGDSTLAVVELFDPVFDEETATLTYDVSLLEHWRDGTDLAFTETPVDVDAIGDTFGTAHLFIDDCGGTDIYCISPDRTLGISGHVGTILNGEHDGFCYSWSAMMCLPCQPWIADDEGVWRYWGQQCNLRFPDCLDNCRPHKV